MIYPNPVTGKIFSIMNSSNFNIDLSLCNQDLQPVITVTRLIFHNRFDKI